METIVQLRAAKIPFVGFIAVHYWYAVIDCDRATRWEIWQRPNLKPESWGHLHKNLMPFDAGVGNGDSWLETVWTGELAQKLAWILTNSPDNYPYNNCYRYVPGPNSNTYAQWVLNQVNHPHRLSIKGIGKNYEFFRRVALKVSLP
jgi:hypothetical protein